MNPDHIMYPSYNPGNDPNKEYDMTMKYRIDQFGEMQTVFAHIDGDLYTASNEHPNFDKIVSLLDAQDPAAADLFDMAETIGRKFAAITERLTVRNGMLYMDQQPVHDGLTKHIVRAVEEGGEFEALALFYEWINANPNEHSREHLYRWCAGHDFSITPDGLIIGYKGVSGHGEVGPGNFSTSRGHAFRNGEEIVNDYIQNEPGDVIEMPRDEVVFDPYNGCSVGLHVGTRAFAQGFAPVLLVVLVNPRDVVSVPTDSHDAKMRVCRYTVIGLANDLDVTAAVHPIALPRPVVVNYLPLEATVVEEVPAFVADFLGEDDEEGGDEEEVDVIGDMVVPNDPAPAKPVVNWHPKNIQTLLAFGNDYVAMQKAFPDSNLDTLKRRQRQFRPGA